MQGQIDIFDFLNESSPVEINKPLYLIELFAGYGSQALALERLGVKFVHHKVCEIDRFAVASYNALHGTSFEPQDITQLHASDLEITHTDQRMYLMTYSFPCTDLSISGKQMGMQKGSGTRSGLLWEVDRILTECNELPQILMMENVSQVHGEKFIDDFRKWIRFLDSLGYQSFYQDLNAKDYGIPQNRERTFMWSFLKSEFGEHPKYEFPAPQRLGIKLLDVLEDEVDEKYYLKSETADKLIEQLVVNGTLEG